MLSGWAVRKLEDWSLGYMRLTCGESGQCYGVLAVHRINFALGMFHLLLALMLVGVQSSRQQRSSIQNGWWGPKLVVYAVFVVVSFLIPNGFFVFYGNWIAIAGSVVFILIGLVLLVDFAHTWAETCLERYEESDGNSKLWQFLLVGSTLFMYLGALTLIILSLVFFAKSGCSLNQTVIALNIVLSVAAIVSSIIPIVQEYNPRSGLAQSAMVVLYASYLTMSAVANEPNDKQCNPLAMARGTQTLTVVMGAIFTFLAIAYSTTRAATQSSTISSGNGTGSLSLEDEQLITAEPSSSRMRRNEAVRAAVEAGALPASALEEDYGSLMEENNSVDDETGGVQYQYSMFHFVFFLATCYTAELLTGWNTMHVGQDDSGDQLVIIGRSYAVVWTKVISCWMVFALYLWSLFAPIFFPDRF